MQYDHEPRRGGGGAGPVLLIIGGCGLLLVMIVALAGYFMWTRFETSRSLAMEQAMRDAKEAEMRARRQHEQAQQAALAEQEALEAKAAAHAKRRAQQAALEAASKGMDAEVEAFAGKSARELAAARERIAALEKELATQRGNLDALQQRFDRRVKDDNEMLKSLHGQLSVTRAKLEEAYARIRELEEKK